MSGKNLPSNYNELKANKLKANKFEGSNSDNEIFYNPSEFNIEKVSADSLTRNNESNKNRKSTVKKHLSSNNILMLNSRLNNFTISTINNSIKSVEKNITKLEEYIEKGYYNHAIPQRRYISEELKLILSRLLKVEERKRTTKYHNMVNHYLELMEKLNELKIEQNEPNMNNFTLRRHNMKNSLSSRDLNFIKENSTLERNPYKTDENILDMFNEKYSKRNKIPVTLPITNNIQEQKQNNPNMNIFNTRHYIKKQSMNNSNQEYENILGVFNKNTSSSTNSEQRQNGLSMLDSLRLKKPNVKPNVKSMFPKINITNSENESVILTEIFNVIRKIYKKTSLKFHPNKGGTVEKFQDFSNYNMNIENFLSNKCNIISSEEIDSIIVLINKTIDNIEKNGFNENIIFKMFEKLNSIVEKSKLKFTQENKVKGFIIGQEYNIKINEKYELCEYIGYVDNTFIFCRENEKIFVKDAKKIKPPTHKESTVKKMFKFFSKK